MDDETFLKSLYDEMKDDGFLDIHRVLGTKAVDDAIGRVKLNLKLSDEEAESYRTLAQQMYEPEKGFRGIAINTLNLHARALLQELHPSVPDVLIAQLPSRELNGFAIAAPSGRPVIIINSGVIFSITAFVRTFICLYSWHMDDYASREFKQEEFAYALLVLARYVVTGDFRLIKPLFNVLMLQSRPWNDTIFHFAFGVELFIVLHEYGHVMLGHLDQHPAMTGKIGETSVRRFVQRHEDEFAADAFAFQALYHTFQKLDHAEAKADVALAGGILFKLFELCEFIAGPVGSDTHPSPSARWARLVELGDVRSYPNSIAADVDALFSAVMSWQVAQEFRLTNQ
jgi:hypothetical protein